MKKFFGEFKTFITRGNVLDMAVGVIVGGAFTAIVNGLSNYILKPIINFLLALILGQDSLSNIYTFLGDPVYKLDTDGTTLIYDLENSFYIDWGAFINAIINFILIAFVLFCIVRMINRVKERSQQIKEDKDNKYLDYNERKELKNAGVKIRDKEAVKAYFAEKEKKALEEAEKEKLAKEEQEKADRLANPTTEDLLKDIKLLLEKQLEK